MSLKRLMFGTMILFAVLLFVVALVAVLTPVRTVEYKDRTIIEQAK